MEQLTSIEFEHKISPRVAMEAIRTRGACAIHNFVTTEQLQAAAELLRSERMILDENLSSRVQRRQRMSAFAIGADDTPDALTALTTRVTDYVHDGNFAWQPNEIIAHRYESTDFIGRHRDYTEACGLVAVLTLDGMQDFYVELDGDQTATKVTMKPGTLTMMRGFTGNPEERPYHWVARPASQRTALSIRDMRHVWTPEFGNWD